VVSPKSGKNFSTRKRGIPPRRVVFSRNNINFSVRKKCTPWEGKSPPGDICAKGGVMLWSGMHCVPWNDVVSDWMQHRKERRMGFLGQYSNNPTHEWRGTCLTILKSMFHNIASLFFKIWDVAPITQKLNYKKIS
jgi:hypothetical protein